MGLFSKVGKTRIIPLGLKIIVIFISLILLSNFATNIITLQLSQKEIISLNNTVMVEQLKELYTNSANQYQIYLYSKDKEQCMETMAKSARTGFSNPNSLAIGISQNNEVLFCAYNRETIWNHFQLEKNVIDKICVDLANGVTEGSIHFSNSNGDYFGVYKFFYHLQHLINVLHD